MKHDTFLHDVLVPMGFWKAFELKGEDVVEWLQGQITNDIKGAGIGMPLDFCMCKPTGQMELDGRLWKFQDSVILLVPANRASVLRDRCENMVIMEDVQCQDLSPSHNLVSIQGPNAAAIAAELQGIVLPSSRGGFTGVDILLQKDAPLPKLPHVDEPTWEVLLLQAGTPVFGVDMNEKTLPPEMGSFYDASHVSYRKGCYTGQEVLMRIHSRGHTNKTWMGLRCAHPLERGERILDGSGGEVGAVTNARVSPELGYIGAAMLRNDSTSGLRTSSGHEVTAHPMPLIEKVSQLQV